MQEVLIQHTPLVLLLVFLLLQTQHGIPAFPLISTGMHQFIIVPGNSGLITQQTYLPRLTLFNGVSPWSHMVDLMLVIQEFSTGN